MSTPTLMTMDFGRDDVGETIKWVRYTDAQAELDRLRAECEGLRAQLREFTDVADAAFTHFAVMEAGAKARGRSG